MVAIKEERELVKLYKKSDICRSDWILPQDFKYVKDRYIPIEYKTPSNKRYTQAGYSIRYIKLEDLNRFINT